MAKAKYKKPKKASKPAGNTLATSPAKDKTIDKNISNMVAMDAVDDFDRFEDFFTSNLKTILMSFGTLAIAVLVGAVIYAFRETATTKVADELLAAKTIDEIESVLKKHPHNEAASVVRLRLATLKFKAGDKKAALDLYSQVAAEATPSEPKNRAALNKAYTLESMGKKKEAAEVFAQIGSNPSYPKYIRNEANYSAARIRLIQGDEKQAAILLKSIDSSTPGFWSVQGKMLLQRIH